MTNDLTAAKPIRARRKRRTREQREMDWLHWMALREYKQILRNTKVMMKRLHLLAIREDRRRSKVVVKTARIKVTPEERKEKARQYAREYYRIRHPDAKVRSTIKAQRRAPKAPRESKPAKNLHCLRDLPAEPPPEAPAFKPDMGKVAAALRHMDGKASYVEERGGIAIHKMNRVLELIARDTA